MEQRIQTLQDIIDKLQEALDESDISRKEDIIREILGEETDDSDEQELLEPGHVWFRFNDMTDWEPGILNPSKTMIIDIKGIYWKLNEIYEITPAHTIPPDDINDPGKCSICGSQMYWGTTEMFVSVSGGGEATQQNAATPVCPQCGKWIPANGGTVRKEEMTDSAGPPPNPFKKSDSSYARQWKEFSDDEITQFNKARRTLSNEICYHEFLRLAFLPTLRSASEFSPEEVEELLNTYIVTKDTDKPHWKAVAAKVQEIERRGTS